MAEKKFDAQVNYGWGLSLNMTGKAPAIAKTIWDTYADMIAYVNDYNDSAIEGLQLSVVADPNEKLNGIYFVNKAGTATEEGVVTLVGSGSGSLQVANFTVTDGKIEEATVDNIGQVIYVTGGTEDYPAGPYIVTGDGTVAKLGTTTATGDIAGDVNTLKGDVATLEGVVGNSESGLVKDVADLKNTVEALPETFVTDVKVDGTSLVSEGIADLSNFVQKDGDKVLSTNDYTTEEKNKLAAIDASAANYIKSVGANLSVDENGKLEVSIPEVEVPFQSIAEGDKVLKLEAGVLSSGLSYAREEVDGVDSLVLKGIDGVVIGSVSVADFIADGMLENVAPKEEGSNIFVFTFNSAAGSKSFEVDFSKYVDTYNADGTTIELDSTNNTFKVKDGVFEEAGAAATVQSNLETYQTANDAAVAAKVSQSDYDAKVAEIDSSISDIKTSLDDYVKSEDVSAALDLKANVADVYTKTDADTSINTAIAAAIAPLATTESVDDLLAEKVDKVEGKSLVDDTLITKLDDLVNITSVTGDLTLNDGALSVDLSGYVQKDGDKVLSTNDYTTEEKNKLAAIAEGAEVNYIKSVGDNLNVDAEGKLTVDLSSLATSEALTTGLAAKLDATAKVNGVSFVDGVATIDAGDVALEANITRTGEDGETETVYSAESSIQSVLANLSQRIDVLDPNVSGELGITSITAGSGVNVETSGGQATISVKASASEGNAAEIKTDGVYVPDMKSYWETI